MLACGSASAQQAAADAPPAPTPEVDLHDLLARLRHRQPSGPGGQEAAPADYRKPVWVFVPLVSVNPSTGLLVGGGIEATFFRGDPKTTHASTVLTSAGVSVNGQFITSVRLNLYSAANTWFAYGDNRFENRTQQSYGLGTSSSPAGQFGAHYHFPKVNEVLFRRVYDKLYAGVGFYYGGHGNVGPSDGSGDAWTDTAYIVYSQAHGLDLDTQVSAGTSVNAIFDTRDSSVNARRGVAAVASYRTYFKGFLGGSSSWQELYVDLRGYRAIVPGDRRQTLALWVYGDFETGGAAPYFDLPATGGDLQGRSGRGYSQGRFRGEQLAYGELEYRATLMRNGLVGVVAFFNLTTASNRQTGERLFDSVAPAGGAGVRFLLDKLSRTNICFDVAFGRQGARGIYLAIQEAF
jgi:hypothetical protein